MKRFPVTFPSPIEKHARPDHPYACGPNRRGPRHERDATPRTEVDGRFLAPVSRNEADAPAYGTLAALAGASRQAAWKVHALSCDSVAEDTLRTWFLARIRRRLVEGAFGEGSVRPSGMPAVLPDSRRGVSVLRRLRQRVRELAAEAATALGVPAATGRPRRDTAASLGRWLGFAALEGEGTVAWFTRLLQTFVDWLLAALRRRGSPGHGEDRDALEGRVDETPRPRAARLRPAFFVVRKLADLLLPRWVLRPYGAFWRGLKERLKDRRQYLAEAKERRDARDREEARMAQRRSGRPWRLYC